MKISFTSKKIQKRCSSDHEMVRSYGVPLAKKLQQRLMELDAAPNMEGIPNYARCHPLVGKHRNRYAVHLSEPHRLLFEPSAEDLVYKEDGGLDLSKITSIIIVDVIDYH